MSNLQNMICPTCKQPTQQANNEIIEYLAKEKDRYRALLGERTEELIRARKALELAITGLKNCKTRDHIGAVCRTPEYVDKILGQINATIKGDQQ